MEKPPTPDQRKRQLLGRWRSDKARTLEELAKRRDITKKQLEFYRKLFGRLEIWYRPTTIVTGFKGKSSVAKYKIIGADCHSVAISYNLKLPRSGTMPVISQIHFEGDYYWINLGGGLREFFKRIKKRRS